MRFLFGCPGQPRQTHAADSVNTISRRSRALEPRFRSHVWTFAWSSRTRTPFGPDVGSAQTQKCPNQQSALWVRFPESYVGVYAQSLLPTQSVRLMRRRCRATLHVHVPIPSPSPAPADALVRLRRSLAATSCPRSRHKGLLLAVDWAKPSRSSSAAQQRARVLVWAPWTRRYARALFLDHHPKTDPDAVSLCLRRLGLVKLAIRYGYVQR